MAGENVAEARIAEALLDLVAEKPLERISITEITERAGVSRVSYYRHFSSKEDILLRHSEYILDSLVLDIEGGALRNGRDFWQRIKDDLGRSRLVICMQKAGLYDRFFAMAAKRFEIIFSAHLGVDLSKGRNLVMMDFVLGGLLTLLSSPAFDSREISSDDIIGFLKSFGVVAHFICDDSAKLPH